MRRETFSFYEITKVFPSLDLSLKTLCIFSYAWMFRDDVCRLEEQINRLSSCPLGSGAIAGCALPIDRKKLAESMGFKQVTPNSMFAVGSRDHIGNFIY